MSLISAPPVMRARHFGWWLTKNMVPSGIMCNASVYILLLLRRVAPPCCRLQQMQRRHITHIATRQCRSSKNGPVERLASISQHAIKRERLQPQPLWATICLVRNRRPQLRNHRFRPVHSGVGGGVSRRIHGSVHDLAVECFVVCPE